MKTFFKKFALFVFTILIIGNINVKRVDAGLADEIVGLFFDTVEDVADGIMDVLLETVGTAEEMMETKQISTLQDNFINQINDDIENSPLYQDLRNNFNQEQLDSEFIFFDTDGDGVIDYDDIGIDQNNELDPDNPNYINYVIISDTIDKVIEDLAAQGFFDDDGVGGEYIDFTEEEFKMILGNILFKDIITQVVDPDTNLPSGQDISEQMDFEIKILPTYPQPGEVVDMEVISNSISLNKSDITWLKDGDILKKGLGQKKLSNYQINQDGNPENITVKIQTKQYGLFEKSITIRPAYVDFYYESDTYVPPFYEGKPEFVEQSMVKVFAIPEILDVNRNRLDPEDFIYKWYLNNNIIDGKKTGENFVYIQDNYLDNENEINVVMEHLSSDLRISKVVYLKPGNPEIILYEEDPALGVLFNKAISNQKNTSEREFSIKAFPYNFNNINDLEYKWQLDGRLISGVIDNFITFRANGSDDIDSNVSLDIRNPINITQSGSKNFNIFVNN